MRQRGSVLIVVLGLLAVLAIIGIAFITMSNLDRTTAANFALQTQFDLAADGAIDYVTHYMVADLWAWTGTTKTFQDGTKGPNLLTGILTGGNSNEPYDYPGPDDLWLATNIVTANTPPTQFSFRPTFTGPLYSYPVGAFNNTDGPMPENLGMPGLTNTTITAANRTGVWIPELCFPYELGLIRVSVTVQDHNALLNFNAHGNKASGSAWTVGDNQGDLLAGKGYFISDVDPTQNAGADVLTRLLVGEGPRVGRWGIDKYPINQGAGEALIENPRGHTGSTGTDLPFTLDEELELRKLTGTPYNSRIELFWPTLFLSEPKTTSTTFVNSRLNYTTVGWVSEARGDGSGDLCDTTKTPTTQHVARADLSSMPKADINLDNEDSLIKALVAGRVILRGTGARVLQLVANIAAFREQNDAWKTPTCTAFPTATGKCTGAKRQVLMTEVSLTPVAPANAGEAFTTTLKIEVYNPWTGRWANDTAALSTSGQEIRIDATGVAGTTIIALPPSVASRACVPIATFTRTISVPAGSTLATVFRGVSLESKTPALTLDRLESDDVTKLCTSGNIHRPIALVDEKRGTGASQENITVLYVKDWVSGAAESLNTVNISEVLEAQRTIPIRFVNSVKIPYNPLPSELGAVPPVAKAIGKSYRAFARLGDLNQVLCPKTDGEAGTAFWPWIGRVAKATDEATVKFNWAEGPITNNTSIGFPNAANVLCAGGPWNDKLDNDGDGTFDSDNSTKPDKGASSGTTDYGTFGGTEMRVAGKININTATEATLTALESSLGIPSSTLKNSIPTARTTQPFRTPASILTVAGISGGLAGDPEAKGTLEKRDLVWTRLSNILTVRSDTFSIYGTVQYIEPPRPPGTTTRLLRSRRFWALVDRSPSLVYAPTDTKFLHPRILNFQWMD